MLGFAGCDRFLPEETFGRTPGEVLCRGDCISPDTSARHGAHVQASFFLLTKSSDRGWFPENGRIVQVIWQATWYDSENLRVSLAQGDRPNKCGYLQELQVRQAVLSDLTYGLCSFMRGRNLLSHEVAVGMPVSDARRRSTRPLTSIQPLVSAGRGEKLGESVPHKPGPTPGPEESTMYSRGVFLPSRLAAGHEEAWIESRACSAWTRESCRVSARVVRTAKTKKKTTSTHV